MSTPKQFWLTLERIPGLSASALEWRSSLGPDWDWAKSLLRPTQEQVETIPIESALHRVVMHAPERVVAVPLDGGRPRSIARNDIDVLELHPERLAALLCRALGFERATGNLRPGGVFAHLGRIAVTRGTVCPVHLCMQCDAALTHSALRRLLVESDGPMVILTPGALEDQDILQIVRLRNACHLALAESIAIDASSQATMTEQAVRALGSFARTVEQWESGSRPDDPYHFERAGRVWVLAFDRAMCYMPHKEAGGLAYIQHLLARPGQEIPVERLEEMVTGNLALDAVSTGEAVVDRAGLERIWNEMRRLQGEIDVAERDGDLAAQSRLQTEHDQLTEQVRLVHGLNDRVRRIGDQTEQLRTKVTNSIRRTIKALENELPSLAAHLSAVRCGKTMSYRPDSTIPWTLGNAVTPRVTA